MEPTCKWASPAQAPKAPLSQAPSPPEAPKAPAKKPPKAPAAPPPQRVIEAREQRDMTKNDQHKYGGQQPDSEQRDREQQRPNKIAKAMDNTVDATAVDTKAVDAPTVDNAVGATAVDTTAVNLFVGGVYVPPPDPGAPKKFGKIG